MISSFIHNKFLQTAVMIVLFSMVAFSREPRDLAKGNLIQFNDNGKRYDGISYAAVDNTVDVSKNENIPLAFSLGMVRINLISIM